VRAIAGGEDATAVSTAATAPPELQAGSKYIATNRFQLQGGAGPKFEKRWAERKSRLAVLDGFEFFTLCRRVDVAPGEEVDFDYISFTVWDSKKAFNAWRTGEAFKEAHGGGTLWGFVSMLVTSLTILKGPPKPAFYEGLQAERKRAASQPEVVEGWRTVAADGVNPLAAECYVRGLKYAVQPGQEGAFEAAYLSAPAPSASAQPGFRFGALLRRDVKLGAKREEEEQQEQQQQQQQGKTKKTKGHGDDPGMDADGVSYMAVSVWDSKEAFLSAQPPAEEEQEEGAAPAALLLRAPQPVFYEGVLVLEA